MLTNAQAVVDEKAQVIIAAKVTTRANEVNQLIPVVNEVTKNLRKAEINETPKVLLADAGYCSESNLEQTENLNTEFIIATGRLKYDDRVQKPPKGRIKKDASKHYLMARKLRTKIGQNSYKKRKAIVEPVFGQMKVRQNAGQLRLRGEINAQGEWMLHVICHNLRKLSRKDQILGAIAT